MSDEWKELNALEIKVRDAIDAAIESPIYISELNSAAHAATRIALKALEQPTLKMIEAGEAVGRNPPYRDRTRDIFIAMIRAAQGEEGGAPNG